MAAVPATQSCAQNKLASETRPSAVAPRPCRALRDAQALLLNETMRRRRTGSSTRAHANPRQNARMYEKYEANRRAFGGVAMDPAEADARTLRWLRRMLGENDEDGGGDDQDAANTAADPGPLLVDPRRVAAMAEFYRVLPDEADDPEYAETMMAARTRGKGGGRGGNNAAAAAAAPPPPPPPSSLPDCLSARDPAAAADLDARARSGGALGVRGAVVRPLDDDEEKEEQDDQRWRRRAAGVLLGARPSSDSPAVAATTTPSTTAAFVLWDVESAPLPPDADPRAAARLLEALAQEMAANRGVGGGGAADDAAAPSPRLSVFGTRPALARIPAAFVSRYAVEGAATSRVGAAGAAAAAPAPATSLGAACAAYYSSRGLLFAPARGAQPSLKYVLRREGAEVVQVGGDGGGGGRGNNGAVARKKTKKRRKKSSSSVAVAAASASAALAPADALAEAADRLLRAHARLRARALFEEEEEEEEEGRGDGSAAPPALLLVVVAGAGELEATGLRQRLAEEQEEEQGKAGGGLRSVVPLLVVAGGGGEADLPSRPLREVSWEALLRSASSS